ncbi:hypothetical protein ACFQDF_21375 [Ectobacillus funiculus]
MVFRIARMIDAMKEKQEYIIPDNVSSDFEVVQNVTVKDLVCFLPTLLVVVPILLMPISIYVNPGFNNLSYCFSCACLLEACTGEYPVLAACT